MAAYNYGYDWMNPMSNSLTYAQSVPNNGTGYSVPQPTASTFRPTSSIVWVQGEAGAKGYPVAPGNTILLMDSESNKFYMKSIDAFGKPVIRTYTYEEEIAAEPVVQNDKVDYVSREEFESLKKQIDDLMA